MQTMPISRAFTLIESGPVVLVTTFDGLKTNIMTISWTMVMDFTPRFAITTGPWNYSYHAIESTKECVIAIPTLDLIDQVVGVGICSGAKTDKFAKFGLTPMKGMHVGAPLIKECLANIECRVIDLIEKHNIVILEGVEAYFDGDREEQRTLHAVGPLRQNSCRLKFLEPFKFEIKMITPKKQYSDEFREQALAKVYNRGDRTIQAIADESNLSIHSA